MQTIAGHGATCNTAQASRVRTCPEIRHRRQCLEAAYPPHGTLRSTAHSWVGSLTLVSCVEPAAVCLALQQVKARQVMSTQASQLGSSLLPPTRTAAVLQHHRRPGRGPPTQQAPATRLGACGAVDSCHPAISGAPRSAPAVYEPLGHGAPPQWTKHTTLKHSLTHSLMKETILSAPCTLSLPTPSPLPMLHGPRAAACFLIAWRQRTCVRAWSEYGLGEPPSQVVQGAALPGGAGSRPPRWSE